MIVVSNSWLIFEAVIMINVIIMFNADKFNQIYKEFRLK